MPQQKIVEKAIFYLRELSRRYAEDRDKDRVDPEFTEYWDVRVRRVERVFSSSRRVARHDI